MSPWFCTLCYDLIQIYSFIVWHWSYDTSCCIETNDERVFAFYKPVANIYLHLAPILQLNWMQPTFKWKSWKASLVRIFCSEIISFWSGCGVSIWALCLAFFNTSLTFVKHGFLENNNFPWHKNPSFFTFLADSTCIWLLHSFQ